MQRAFVSLLSLVALAVTTPVVSVAAEALSPAPLEGLSFRMVGPHRGGRSTAVSGVPGEPFTFLMGTTGGGVWKTTNAGESWENVSDGFFATASIGAIAVAATDPNVVYVGTGSACPRGNVILGDGVYRSRDGGRTWTHAGLGRAGLIGRIRVDPRDPDRLYVAVLGQIFGPSEERGVYRSEDGGDSWERVLHVSARTGAVDLVMNPGNPRELYAAMWTAERKPWTLIDGGPEGGMYKTVDGGDTWEKLAGGLPGGELGRIGLAASPARPGRVWALVTARGERGGLYRSDDWGESWRRLTGDRELRTRGWYYTHVVAHPTDADTLFVMNARFWKSIDGGKSFTSLATPHGDNHDLWIDPTRPETMIEANDGGAAVTLDGGATWSTIYNQPTAELYRLTVDERFPYRLYGAQQDNSTISVPAWSEGGISTKGDWWLVPGGESGHVGLHPERPEVTYAGNYIGTIMRHDRTTGETRNVIVYPELADGVAPKDLEYRFQWNAPIRVSPHDPDLVYHASNVVHASRDGGLSWTTISPDLTRDDETKQELPGGPIQHDDTGVEVYNTIFALEESPHQKGVLWAGSDDGLVHVSRDGGESWSDVTPPELPADTTVNSIELSPHAPDRVFLAAHRYRLDDFSPFIFRSDDGGVTWKRLTDGDNGIPADHPVRVVREDPDRRGLLYAGTEYGLFVSFDDGGRWQPLELGLPKVQIADLAVHEKDLVVATHGRSFWVLDDLTPLHELDEEVAASPVHLFTPRPTHRVASGGFGEGAEPDRRPSGALLRVYFADEPAERAKLTILDPNGQSLRELILVPEGSDEETEEGEETVSVTAGTNQIVWDLRTTRPETVEGSVMSLGYTGGTPVPPGSYRVRLEAGELSQERPLELLPDPRLAHITPEDYQAGWELATTVRERMVEIHQAVETMRSVRAQLDDLVKRVDAAGLALELDPSLKERVDSAKEALTDLEEILIQTKNEARQDPLNFPPKLDNQYSHLYGQVVGMTGRPTAGAYRRLDDLDTEWGAHRERLRELLRRHLDPLNEALLQAEVPAILPPN